jgi:hypothetical protein
MFGELCSALVTRLRGGQSKIWVGFNTLPGAGWNKTDIASIPQTRDPTDPLEVDRSRLPHAGWTEDAKVETFCLLCIHYSLPPVAALNPVDWSVSVGAYPSQGHVDLPGRPVRRVALGDRSPNRRQRALLQIC